MQKKRKRKLAESSLEVVAPGGSKQQYTFIEGRDENVYKLVQNADPNFKLLEHSHQKITPRAVLLREIT